MTLATHMWVLDPVDLDQLWTVGRSLIHANSDRAGQAAWKDEPTRHGREGSRQRYHGIGQGFCSMYDLDYMPDGSLLHDGTVEHDEWCQYKGAPCTDDHSRDKLAYYYVIAFDTAYGYRGPNGEGCGDLHSRLVGTIGAWLDAQNVRWAWENEFTGEIHQGADGLDKLGKGGADAKSWMMTALTALIEAGYK